MAKDYAEQRASILRDLDGLRYEVDTEKRVGRLWLDRPPLNIVSYRGRSQIAAIMEAFGQDPDVRVVVIRGANGVYSSGGDVKAFPEIERDGMSDLAQNIAAPAALPQAGDLRDGEIRHGRRPRARDVVRHPPRHQGYGAGAARGVARPDPGERRQPAHRPHRRPHPRRRHDAAGPAHPGRGGATRGACSTAWWTDGAALDPRSTRRSRSSRRSPRSRSRPSSACSTPPTTPASASASRSKATPTRSCAKARTIREGIAAFSEKRKPKFAR